MPNNTKLYAVQPAPPLSLSTNRADCNCGYIPLMQGRHFRSPSNRPRHNNPPKPSLPNNHSRVPTGLPPLPSRPCRFSGHPSPITAAGRSYNHTHLGTLSRWTPRERSSACCRPSASLPGIPIQETGEPDTSVIPT